MVNAIFAKLRASVTPVQPSLADKVQHEISLYTSAPPVDHSSCPLAWWATNAANYPNVARLARKLLSVPATSVASERLFSKAGDVITKKRNRIDSAKADKLIFNGEHECCEARALSDGDDSRPNARMTMKAFHVNRT